MEERHELRPRGLFIPLELFDDERLSHLEVLLVVLIDMLDGGERHCYATNKYLAGRLRGVSEQHISNSLTALRKCGWVMDAPRGTDFRRLTTRLREIRKLTLPKNRKGGSEKSEGAVPKNRNARELLEMNLEEREETALSLHQKYFPEVNLNPFQQDILYTIATDLEVWRGTCKFWASNGYQGRQLNNMLDKYKRDVESKSVVPRAVTQGLDGCLICENGMKEDCPYHGRQNAT